MKSSFPRGVYIHVPFCLSKCSYCDFYSCPGSQSDKDQYIRALQKEIRLRGTANPGPADTLFFGGGTPSCLSTAQIATVLDECGRYFPLCADAEVSMEVNPGTLTGLDLGALRQLGVNRLSIGMQASQDRLLKLVGRGHDRAMFDATLAEARKAGFANISADVIYGLPGQSLDDYVESLHHLRNAAVDHVSCYALQLEPGTALWQAVMADEILLPDDEKVVAMYETGRAFLRNAGYAHYEISNFARPGMECRHNLKYWRNEEYLGLGPAAAGFLEGRRYVNVADTAGYIKLLDEGRLPVGTCEMLSGRAHRAETAMLALRLLREGIDRKAYLARYACDP
ncbi:MAG TPA: radical SAM family heme chaperone HemW, partial [Bacillota bacterium]|nr:radical SAM family heme chaperone HemW [Bacillota bacterium]